MNLSDAKAILLAQSWVWNIVKIPNRGPNEKRWKIHRAMGDPNCETFSKYDECTDSELIRIARHPNHLCGTSIKKTVKKFHDKKNRAATRNALASEDFDKIPQEGIVKGEDIWSWD